MLLHKFLTPSKKPPETEVLTMKKHWIHSALLILAFSVISVRGPAQTFIRATLPNPGHEAATAYRFQIVTPGDVLEAVAQTDKTNQISGDARFLQASLASNPSNFVQAVHNDNSTITFPFEHPIAINDRIDLRVAFNPKEYWKVYFNDVFQYADGHTESSGIPYAAFFISYEPTEDPAKMKASLTIVNNIASTYGIPKSMANDDMRRPITFRNSRVYINNTMAHYDLQHFDHPDGQRLNLPTAFTLKAGEAQTFDLGLVDAKSYVLTMSEISYDGDGKVYPIACSHPTEPPKETASSLK
jgi:hypothetical protein